MDVNGHRTNDETPEGRRSQQDGTGAGDGTASAAADRMRQAATAAARGNASRAELESAARALVKELRQQQQPPEQVLLQIKSFLAEAGLRPGYPTSTSSSSNTPLPTPTLYRDLISWSIKFYYEDGDRGARDGGAPSEDGKGDGKRG